MARLELLVNGVRRRFALSSASTDSLLPSYLVPEDQIRREPTPVLKDVMGSRLTMLGTFRAVLESPGPDPGSFSIAFTLNVPRVRADLIGVLGQDFIRAARMPLNVFEWDWTNSVVEARCADGRRVRLHFTEAKESEPDYYFIPTVRRESDELVMPPPYKAELAELAEPKNGKEDVLDKKSTAEQADDKSAGSHSATVVLLDLETTGMSNKAEVIQLAAMTMNSEKTFNVYIMPKGDIQADASRVTGLVKKASGLFLKDKEVTTTPARMAVLEFLSFLRSVGGRVVLVAHNAFGFDANRLLKLVGSARLMPELEKHVVGFADTIPLFKETLPARAANKGKFSMAALTKDLLVGESFSLHNAEEDLRALDRLIQKVGLSAERIIESAKPVNQFNEYKRTNGAT